MKTICLVLSLVLFAHLSNGQRGPLPNPGDLYKKIPHHQSQPRYWLFIHSNDCSYTITINDMPVYTDFNDGSTKSLSFPINPLLLKSGEHKLHLSLLPRMNGDFKLDTAMSKEYSATIRIVRNENKKDAVVLEKTINAGSSGSDFPSIKYTTSFNVELPYQLTGWKDGVNLQYEDKSALEKEVVAYYSDMIRDYKNGNFNSVAKKYHKRLLEHAESLYFDQPEDTKKLMVELKKDIDKKQAFKLEHYALQFYGDGKVVALIRTDGEFRGKSAFLGLTDDNFYAYKLLLYRPKAGESLQTIR